MSYKISQTVVNPPKSKCHDFLITNAKILQIIDFVQQVVSKQFNSPIGLYSDQNIADTIKCQASAIP